MKKKIISLLVGLSLCTSIIVTTFATNDSGRIVSSSDIFHYDKMMIVEDSIVCAPLETNADILQLNDGSGPILLDTYSNDALVDADIMNMELENNLAIAGDAYDSLMKTFYNAQPDSQKHNPDVYSVGGISAEGFPKTFAGAYLNRNLDLVVLLTEDAAQSRTMLSNAQKTILQATDTDQLIFSTAEFSYSDLVSLMNDIYQYLKTGRNGKDGFEIVYCFLEDYNNRVLVGLAPDSEECRTSFQNAIGSSDAFAFESASGSGFEKDTILQPGASLSNGSVGFRARKRENGSYTYGYLTAAHCCAPGAVVRDEDNYWIGVARADLYQLEGNLDAVFVECEYGFSTIINYTWKDEDYEELKAGIDTYLAQGNPVSKSGQATKLTKGVIVSSSCMYDYDGETFFDFGAADYDAANGDSGGIVYTTRSGNNWIAGIHTGRGPIEKPEESEEPEDDEIRAVFCKAINITPAFGLSLY